MSPANPTSPYSLTLGVVNLHVSCGKSRDSESFYCGSSNVSKVYIIRGTRKRWQDGLFLFNTFGMLLPYCVVITLTFI